ncbi:hypothetical protein QBC34DRAFT_499969 [Podospora aff. communis PSN243]|uniref:Uncharacterized protein n=1 Tax=Podospora aff. communis PSN243 TaxID=3040156 RepID=A0AAV9G234_9PEZI|nr:hypothetical protein QBC34DRAFT_499969 [Podospora aff. communis PSN243]
MHCLNQLPFNFTSETRSPADSIMAFLTFEVPGLRALRSSVGTRGNILANSSAIWPTILAWTLLFIFTIIYSMFIARVLLSGNPFIGTRVFDASTTNLLLSVFSQLYAMLLTLFMGNLLDDLRWSLAANDYIGGISALEFAQLGPGVGFFTNVFMTFAKGLRSPAGLAKMFLPIAAISFGSVLKVQNSFVNDVYGSTVGVSAGTMLLNTAHVQMIPKTYLTHFFGQWTESMLRYPRFVAPWPTDLCTVECYSHLLPGSLEQVRLRPTMEKRVTDGNLYPDAEAIRVHQAPGIGLIFTTPERGVFNMEEDCEIYGNTDHRGLQICLRQLGDSIAAAWRACPQQLLNGGQCTDLSLWSASAFEPSHITVLTTYQQLATTTFDWKDETIKDIDDDAAVQALLNSPSLVLTLGWGSGSTDNTERLRNFLAIGIHFGTSAEQYANVSANKIGFHGLLPLPEDMATTATLREDPDFQSST